jgi:two-component system, cell cycle sensor histidine kinase and response regulator CckA
VQPFHHAPRREQLAVPVDYTASLSLFVEQRVVEQQVEPSSIKISGIVHDFNNLLAIILTHTTIALNKLPVDSPARSHLDRTVRTARRMAELSNHLLADMKSRRIESALLDVNQVILETVDLLNPRLTPKAQVALQLASDLHPVLGNDSQLQQVIMNLLLNAADAIPARAGHITVSTANIMVPEGRRPMLNAPAPGHYVCLQVVDDGVGMDQPTLDHIFQPFYTTKPAGTGIGLTATLNIIHAHHGGIQVFSRPEQGTTFRVLLPAVLEDEF